MKVPGTLLRACARGNSTACDVARKIHALYAGSMVTFVEADKVKEHENKLPFTGTLLICDEPSTKPPHGSEGHRILVRKEVAESQLDTLPGMAVNYDPSDMDEHATKHKVGVITKAWMDGNKVKVSGFAWKKDFPEVVRDLKKPDLGMSMELGSVWVDDEHSDVWDLSDFSFTGATILKRDAAAYNKTSLAASKDREEGEQRMPKPVEAKKKVAASRDTGQGDITAALSTALANVMTPFVAEIKASNERVAEELEEIRGMRLIEAAAEDEDEEEEVIVHAAKEDDDDDEDDMAAGKDDDDEDDMAAAEEDDDASSESSSSSSDMAAMEDLELDPADQEPGEVNKDASNRGRKTSVTKPPKQGEKFSGNVAKGRLHSAADRRSMKGSRVVEAAALQIQKLSTSNKQLRRQLQAATEQSAKQTKKLKTQIQAMNAQLVRFSEQEERRSVMPRELVNLAAKAGYNIGEVKANGQKFSIDAVDHIFEVARQSGTVLEPEQRIALKNLLTEHNLLEDGNIGQA